MKQFPSLFFTILLFFTSNLLIGQQLTFEPVNPIPGEKIQISYNPIGTDLQRAEKIEVICYEFSEDGPSATEVYLQIKDNAYSGTILISKDAKAIFISLSADDKKDNNNGIGYGTAIYQKDRKTPQPGAFASLASVYGSYYRNVGVERDYEKALVYLQKEYSQYPDLKKEGKYLGNYSFYATKAKDEKVLAECEELIKTLRMHAQDEEDLMTISSIYSSLGETEEAKAVTDKALEEYPNGELVQNNLVNSFYKTKNLEEKLEIYTDIMTTFGDGEMPPPPMDRINSNLALEYGKMEDWAKFNTFFKLIKDPVQKASILNSLAWALSGESIDATPKQANKGRELSKQSLDLLKSEMETGASKPTGRTKNQWKKQLEYSYGMYADTYALCAYHEGDFKDALKYQTIACGANNFRDGEMSERYCVYLEKSTGSKAVEIELQKLIAQGVATAKMKEQYQRVYFENNTLETAFENNMAFLQSMADEKKMEDLKKKMIKEKAPDFSLVNLQGKKVDLSDLKGKVVVLDFWATWCGPCKASFPGMQNAVDKYKNADDVVFLFLDTWEKGEMKEENAQKFITEKGYTFNVLMDNDNEIVAKFKVAGIPTKFVVDKNGNIRFKSVGYSGNNDELVSELSMMIEMANEASSKEKTMP